MSNNDIIRCCVSGQLKTGSPLCIGNGETELKSINGENVEVSQVAKDFRGKPIVPGSSLKGCLRNYASACSNSGELVQTIFGSGEEKNERGGHVIFSDAPLDGSLSVIPELFKKKEKPVPLHWDENRFTYIETGNAISRQTGTTEKHMLYQRETVSSGAVFKVNFYCEDISFEDLGFFLTLLDDFNQDDGITMGSDTAKGKGKMEWECVSVSGFTRCTNKDRIKQWFSQGSVGFSNLPSIDTKIILKYYPSSLFISPVTQKTIIDLAICFQGPFMVNDPSGAVADKKNKEKSLAHVYLKNENNLPVLRGSSLHGALRSQAERIIRTVSCGRDKACLATQKESRCAPINKIEDVDSLCMVCQVFGGMGWKSPINVSDFVLQKKHDHSVIQQDFVAIDRFTGGGAESKKFNAQYLYQPVFEGRIELDLSRIKPSHIGLMIFVFRDLMEGDIPLGFGKNKGFGACKAIVQNITLPSSLPSWLSIDPEKVQNAGSGNPDSEQIRYLTGMIKQFEKEMAA